MPPRVPEWWRCCGPAADGTKPFMADDARVNSCVTGLQSGPGQPWETVAIARERLSVTRINAPLRFIRAVPSFPTTGAVSWGGAVKVNLGAVSPTHLHGPFLYLSGFTSRRALRDHRTAAFGSHHSEASRKVGVPASRCCIDPASIAASNFSLDHQQRSLHGIYAASGNLTPTNTNDIVRFYDQHKSRIPRVNRRLFNARRRSP
jgi:hypothetical protein